MKEEQSKKPCFSFAFFKHCLNAQPEKLERKSENTKIQIQNCQLESKKKKMKSHRKKEIKNEDDLTEKHKSNCNFK